MIQMRLNWILMISKFIQKDDKFVENKLFEWIYSDWCESKNLKVGTQNIMNYCFISINASNNWMRIVVMIIGHDAKTWMFCTHHNSSLWLFKWLINPHSCVINFYSYLSVNHMFCSFWRGFSFIMVMVFV